MMLVHYSNAHSLLVIAVRPSSSAIEGLSRSLCPFLLLCCAHWNQDRWPRRPIYQGDVLYFQLYLREFPLQRGLLGKENPAEIGDDSMIYFKNDVLSGCFPASSFRSSVASIASLSLLSLLGLVR